MFFLKRELRISLAALLVIIIVSPSEAEVSDVDIGMKLEVASKPLEDDEIVAALAAVVPDSELDVKVFECIFSRKLENRNWLFPTMSSYSYGQDKCQ